MTTRRMLIGLAFVSAAAAASYVGSRPYAGPRLSVAASAQSKRPLQPDDIFALKTVRDPRISPDGAWVALHRVVARSQGRQFRHRRLHGGDLRRPGDPAHEQQEAGDVAALEPGRASSTTWRTTATTITSGSGKRSSACRGRTRSCGSKLSPFYRLDRIVTPTLVMGGDADMNVPVIGGQQLYQGLKRLGRETELVVYPGETHAIRRPSFQQDRFERYIPWYSKYLKPASRTSSQ